MLVITAYGCLTREQDDSRAVTAIPAEPAPSETTTAALLAAGCSDPGLLTFLDGVQEHAATGTLDPDVAALDWHTGLLQAASGTSPEVRERVDAATRTVEAYLATETGTATARAHGRAIARAAVKVVEACGLEADYDITVPKKAKPRRSPTPEAERSSERPAADPRFGSCAAANRAGHGPYYRGADVEYGWYEDRDGDGTVCER
ncbi:excalibur calcium-binding domain-containing protein [Streptosporangium sp. NBC_01755]|uniref:excalibur calcium-binding domain-containing protein n=1 Tax=Streptosporangium sp. NBC_01755 TaxID=2975949 RepID=UPI002DD7BD20|nr:excalibur calcium-binding domain-containing protein [Streptosporangium sp. NBC_01755]WSD03195.1 excalibur calcium-binding domain-containing protein [Streptosporangium sp. NBC_01755]